MPLKLFFSPEGSDAKSVWLSADLKAGIPPGRSVPWPTCLLSHVLHGPEGALKGAQEPWNC